MIPYYVFAIISIALYAVLGDMMEKAVDGGYSVTLCDSIKGMIYANSGNGLMRWNMPLWYLPMLFGLMIIAWFIFQDNRPILVTFVILVGTVVLGALCYKFKLDNLPFGFETSIYVLPFFSIGVLIGEYEKQLKEIPRWGRFSLGVVLLLLGTVMSIGEGQISYNADSYGARGYLYFFLMAGSLCVGFTLLATLIEKNIKWITYVGRNTIGIMTMHKFPIMFFVGLLPVTKKLIGNYPLSVSFVVAIISTAMCLMAAEIIYFVCPFILGRKRAKK